jgi:hypothetical protein
LMQAVDRPPQRPRQHARSRQQYPRAHCPHRPRCRHLRRLLHSPLDRSRAGGTRELQPTAPTLDAEGVDGVSSVRWTRRLRKACIAVLRWQRKRAGLRCRCNDTGGWLGESRIRVRG